METDAVDEVIAEASRLAAKAIAALSNARSVPPQFPLPRVRAATLLRCAAAILDDLG